MIQTLRLIIWKLREPMKYLLMFLKEILMICLDKKVYLKSRKDQNQKGETTDPICLFHYLNFMKEGQWHLVLEGDRFVDIVKVQAMKEDSFIHASLVTAREKWLELYKFKGKRNKCKWNAINVKEQAKHHNKSVQFAVDKKFN